MYDGLHDNTNYGANKYSFDSILIIHVGKLFSEKFVLVVSWLGIVRRPLPQVVVRNYPDTGVPMETSVFVSRITQSVSILKPPHSLHE